MGGIQVEPTDEARGSGPQRVVIGDGLGDLQQALDRQQHHEGANGRAAETILA